MNKQLPGWVDFGLLPILNLLTAFLIAGLVVVAIGENPLEAVGHILFGAFGYGEGIGYTIFYTTNFVFTGLAVAVAFHASQFNIGGEGQAYIGGLGVGLACLALDSTLPWWGILPFAMLGGALFGGIWGAIPGYLYAKRGAHVVITTIMFNFISFSLMVYVIVNFLKTPSNMAVQSRTFEQSAWLPKLTWLDGLVPGIAGSPANVSVLVALAACVFVYILIWRTKFGYEVRTFGANPEAARYAGISTTRVVVIVMAISGALAGLMALNPVMGEQNRVFLDIPQQAGFVGIAVALMGRSHPLWIIFAALLFGMLYQGGAELAFEMPSINRDMIVVIQGLVILFAGAMEFMFRPMVAKFFAGEAA
ncbi:simple sugar transport system permease protein [Rubricella aquisinus]|uniref:Simple sugar transport system permease protein n=1 Tax=Rubricella aquisinus TaxID=2028108 RepID=A0A840WV29_9RHOB|nr:ABC transporter permease [Rubricella aquisinus]MBB5515060.1 simple sugar transport system permease protein [Rubricella aquisinus]